MSVVRIHKNSDYTVMSNYHFREKDMSLKAKGLLSLMLSLPEDWDYSIAGLVTLSSDKETSVRNALNELEDFGYLERKPVKEKGKIIDWEYNIFEKPLVENPQVEKPLVENVDNKILNKPNTKKVNSSSINTTVEFLGSGKSTMHKKESLYSKAIALIHSFTNDKEVQKALVGFLDLQLEIYRDSGKVFYTNIWKSRLNKLKKDFNEEEWLDVVNYATSKGWQNFYPLPTDNRHDVRKGKAWEDNVVSISITREEREAEEREADRLEAKGIRARF